MQRSLILELATEVRTGLLALSNARHPAVRRIERILAAGKISKATFPHQWCDFATCVLAGHIARDTSIVDIELVKGLVPDTMESHWWLSVGGYYVDITCDQFEGAPACPFVEPESNWHASRYPDPAICNIFTRKLQANYFERALVALACGLDSLDSVRRRRVVRALCRFSTEEDRESGHGTS